MQTLCKTLGGRLSQFKNLKSPHRPSFSPDQRPYPSLS
ncbi:hypothetical protein EPr2_0069 [Providencia phage EPr2]|uniref:Uncharacterized protein n=1 Tax=Providencia phage EPr2 TaxID=2917333 RepID=A0AC61TT53_9CAUD|nr:hypothetical protein EPr2_0069 [Providencia phage EPr2]